MFRSDRNNSKKAKRGRDSGGVAFYVRDDISVSFEPILKYTDGVVELLVLFSEVENVIIAVLYRPPDSRERRSTSHVFGKALNLLTNTINKLCSNNTSPDIIIGGDFNLPHCNWKNGSIRAGVSNDELQMIKCLEDFSNEHFLSQHITSPTHIHGNTLDLVFTNNETLIHTIECTNTVQSISHHNVIRMATQYKVGDIEKVKKDAHNLLSPFDELNFHDENIDWESINTSVRSINFERQFENKSAQKILDLIYQIAYDEVVEFVPKRRKKVQHKLGRIPTDRRKLMRRRGRVNKSILKCTTEARKELLRKELIQIEISIQKSLHKSASYQESKAISAIKTNPKFFFSYVKKFSKVKESVGPLLNEKLHYTNDPKEMADLLSRQYTKVFSVPSLTHVDPKELFENDTHTLTDINFTLVDIISAIKSTRSNSASGPDGLPIILLQKCLPFANALFIFWKKCWDEGITLPSLKQPVVIPIHKGGSKGVPAHYRPISLTSHIIKIFERVVRKEMVIYIEENGLFNPSQHGFRIGRSCLSQLLSHYDKIISTLEDGNNADVIYLDFSKAFDKVDIDILLKKVANLGIGGKIGMWLHSFLTNRSQSVLVNGVKSESAPVISGVPQGSVLGPLLFLILIADIDRGLIIALLSSFADDTRMIAAVSTLLQITNFQIDLESVYDWAQSNKMEFNDLKFELLRYWVFDNDLQYCTNYTSHIGSIIQDKESVKDLGVLMCNDGKFDTHIFNVIVKVKRLVSWVLRTFKARTGDVMLTLWKLIILPHIEYASQLWCPLRKGLIQKLEDLQWSYLRKIKVSIPQKNYWSILSHLKMYSLERRRERYRIIYLWKIIEKLVPNLSDTNGEIVSIVHPRHGRQCSLMNLNNSASTKVSNLRNDSFSVHATRLFNVLPYSIRNTTNCSVPEFKSKLDRFLSSVPDEPQIVGMTQYRRAETNSLVDMIHILGH